MIGSLAAVLPFLILGGVALTLGLRWRRLPSAYEEQVKRLAASGGMSRPFARGFVSMFVLLAGSLLTIGIPILVHVVADSTRNSLIDAIDKALFPVAMLGVLGIFASFLLAWFHWPIWLVPRHARDDPRPITEWLEARRVRRRSG